jgi:hypothetical protein
MNGCGIVLAKKFTLQPQFVSSDYFLCRVRELEHKYDKSWGEFYAEFSSGQGRENPDFIEWAFLCRTFMPELIEQESPPGGPLEIVEAPESNSGVFILERFLVRSGSVLQASRKDHEHLQGDRYH